MKLRVVPVVATLKYLPFGARNAFQPYVGVGLAVYVWRYSETGEFVDFTDNSIYRAAYVGSGTSVGPVATFGIRARVSGRADAGIEVRAQWGQGNLSNDFLSNKIDLGGVNVLGTLRIRF
jgi:outer membrane protein W